MFINFFFIRVKNRNKTIYNFTRTWEGELKILMIFINVAPLINTHLNDYKLLYNCVYCCRGCGGDARGFSIKINEFQKAIKQNPKNDDFNFFSHLVFTDDAAMS